MTKELLARAKNLEQSINNFKRLKEILDNQLRDVELGYVDSYIKATLSLELREEFAKLVQNELDTLKQEFKNLK